MSRSDPADVVDVQSRITRALGELTQGDGRPPPSYVRRHFAEHAAAASLLTDALLRPEFLPYVDIARVRQLPGSNRLAAGPLLRRVAHRWDYADPDANAAVLQLWSATLGEPATVPAGRPWRINWATPSSDSSEILEQFDDPVTALAVTTLPDSATVVAVAVGPTVHLWEIESGRRFGPTLIGHRAAVAAVAFAEWPGYPCVVVTGGHDNTVRIWNGLTSQPIGEPLGGHTDWVVAVATATLPDGRPIAVTGSWDKTVRIWDLRQGQPITPALTGHTGPVSAIATTALPDGRPVAVSGGQDGTIRSWDLQTGQSLGRPIAAADSAIQALSAAPPDGRSALVVTGGADGNARVWDLASGRSLGRPIPGRTNGIAAVILIKAADDRWMVLNADNDNSVQQREALTRKPVGVPLIGHTRRITAMTTTSLADGRRLLVTASADRTVRIWDLATISSEARVVLDGHVWCIAISDAGRLAAGVGAGDVWCLDYRAS